MRGKRELPQRRGEKGREENNHKEGTKGTKMGKGNRERERRNKGL